MILMIALGAILSAAGAACSGVGPFSPNGQGGQVSVTPIDPVLGEIGATQQLTVTLGDGLDLSGDQPIAWSSSSPSVATVDGTGLVTALGDGNATITARWNGVSGTANVTVAATLLFTARVSASDQTDGNSANDTGTATITITR